MVIEAVLTFIGCLAIFMSGAILGRSYRWMKTGQPFIEFRPIIEIPPITVNVEVPPVTMVADLSQAIPSPLAIQFQPIPPDRKMDGIPDKPVDVKVFNYIAQESEEHARESRLRYARKLYNELGNWDLVLQQLEMEDSLGH